VAGFDTAPGVDCGADGGLPRSFGADMVLPVMMFGRWKVVEESKISSAESGVRLALPQTRVHPLYRRRASFVHRSVAAFALSAYPAAKS
jgi:hypothetical protein